MYWYECTHLLHRGIAPIVGQAANLNMAFALSNGFIGLKIYMYNMYCISNEI